jgi:branched-chain amino acid transport system substrate-binding protein
MTFSLKLTNDRSKNIFSCRLLTLSALGLVGLLVATSSVAQLEPFKIGAVFAVTGPASFLGDVEAKAARLAVDQVNSSGGIKGRKVELILEDSKSQETAAVLSIRKLITQDKVSVILGPSRTGDAMAAIPIVNEAGIVMLPPVSGVGVVEPVAQRKFIFRPGQGGELSVGKVLDYANRAGWKRLGVLYSSDAYGEDGRDNMRRLSASKGVLIAREESFSPTATDLKPQLVNFRSANVDAIFVHGVGAPSVVVYRNASELGLKTPLVSGHGQANSAFRKAVGDDVVGQPVVGAPVLVWQELPAKHPQRAPSENFNKLYQAKYGVPPDMFAGVAYDSALMTFKAFEEVGDDRLKIRDWFETRVKNFVGVTGTFTFSATDHGGLTSDALVMMIATPQGWRLADYEK